MSNQKEITESDADSDNPPTHTTSQVNIEDQESSTQTHPTTENDSSSFTPDSLDALR